MVTTNETLLFRLLFLSIVKQAIAFDLDGTLVDVSIRDYQIYKDLVNRLGGNPISFDEYWPLRRARTDIHKILEDSGIHNSGDVDFFLINRKSLMEDKGYLRLDRIFPDVNELLSDLSKDYLIYILTIRHKRQNTEAQLQLLGINQYNNVIVEGNKEQHMSLIPNLTYMIGDAENDILPANNLGITSIAVTTGIRNRKLLQEMSPKYIIDNIAEVKDIVYGG